MGRVHGSDCSERKIYLFQCEEKEMKGQKSDKVQAACNALFPSQGPVTCTMFCAQFDGSRGQRDSRRSSGRSRGIEERERGGVRGDSRVMKRGAEK